MAASAMPAHDLRIAIIGAGFAGIGAAIAFRRAGFSNVTLFEKADDIGGVWRDNRYPGAACDIPSRLYSFSFEPKLDWQRRYATQAEILDYLRHCVGKHGLAPRIRFNTEIAAAHFIAERGVWLLHTGDGDNLECDVLISGAGQLSRPQIPAIAGSDSFAGRSFHSARWAHDHDLDGRDIAVIGSGASAVQFVPHIAGRARSLTVFQRSPTWILPRHDRRYGAVSHWLQRTLPPWQRLVRGLTYLLTEKDVLAFRQGSLAASLVKRRAEWLIRRQVSDPALREQLRPADPVGCKRILLSSDFYPALDRPNVALVTAPIARIAPDGVETADGRRHRADTLIFATGFQASDFLAPIRITGRDGVTLAERWRDGAQAHLGISIDGFPNFFLLYGPNTNLGHNSAVFMIECQIRYVIACLHALIAQELAWLDIRSEAARDFSAALQERLRQSVWSAGCSNWYKTASGRVVNNWAGSSLRYWLRTRRPDFSAFVLAPRRRA